VTPLLTSYRSSVCSAHDLTWWACSLPPRLPHCWQVQLSRVSTARRKSLYSFERKSAFLKVEVPPFHPGCLGPTKCVLFGGLQPARLLASPIARLCASVRFRPVRALDMDETAFCLASTVIINCWRLVAFAKAEIFALTSGRLATLLCRLACVARQEFPQNRKPRPSYCFPHCSHVLST
jgi:hypothetical protein